MKPGVVNAELLAYSHTVITVWFRVLSNLRMSGSDHLHPLGLRFGLEQGGSDAVLNGFFHVGWAAVCTVQDIQVFCSQLNIVVFLWETNVI